MPGLRSQRGREVGRDSLLRPRMEMGSAGGRSKGKTVSESKANGSESGAAWEHELFIAAGLLICSLVSVQSRHRGEPSMDSVSEQVLGPGMHVPEPDCRALESQRRSPRKGWEP